MRILFKEPMFGVEFFLYFMLNVTFLAVNTSNIRIMYYFSFFLSDFESLKNIGKENSYRHHCHA